MHMRLWLLQACRALATLLADSLEWEWAGTSRTDGTYNLSYLIRHDGLENWPAAMMNVAVLLSTICTASKQSSWRRAVISGTWLRLLQHMHGHTHTPYKHTHTDMHAQHDTNMSNITKTITAHAQTHTHRQTCMHNMTLTWVILQRLLQHMHGHTHTISTHIHTVHTQHETNMSNII